jgi:hypothetical protein
MQGFPGWFYPSTRQRCVFGSTYKSSTRQITRQKASATRQEMRYVHRLAIRYQMRLSSHSGRAATEKVVIE